MIRSVLVPALVGLSLSTAAFAAPDTKVREINVDIDITALTNAQAATRFANMEADLENALTARLVDRIAETGVRINVDISEVELSNSYTENMGLAQTRLVGNVNVSDETNNSNYESYELTINVETSRPFIPAGVDVTVLPVNSDVYYSAMIAAFADGVVKNLDD
ncbi:hypothetical protein RNZ50_10540 [Paracoccaceae bacterium Fryx2]|nr:hypothetical protein [Paracoccaceae bacterium Fryx2]